MKNVCMKCSNKETCKGIKNDPGYCQYIEEMYDESIDSDYENDSFDDIKVGEVA